MRIQWSGDVAQEMLGKLQEANRGMQECLRRAAAARHIASSSCVSVSSVAAKESLISCGLRALGMVNNRS